MCFQETLALHNHPVLLLCTNCDYYIRAFIYTVAVIWMPHQSFYIVCVNDMCEMKCSSNVVIDVTLYGCQSFKNRRKKNCEFPISALYQQVPLHHKWCVKSSSMRTNHFHRIKRVLALFINANQKTLKCPQNVFDLPGTLCFWFQHPINPMKRLFTIIPEVDMQVLLTLAHRPCLLFL